MEKHISLAKAAELLGVTTKTLRVWDAGGKLKTIRTPGNQRRVPESEVSRILGQNESSNSIRRLYHGSPDTPFSQIFRRFPIESWYNLYSLHEVSDETLWDKTLGSNPGDAAADAQPPQTPEPYTFGGRRHPFSNYYPAPTVYEGIAYSTSEAAFQSAKTLDADARRAFINIDPGKAKRDGRSLNLRPDWEQVKYRVMLDVLSSKFQDPVLRQMLLDTGDRLIIEDTTGWHDNEWGDCHCEKCRHVTGRNMLGKALMEIRSFKQPG